MRAMPSPANGAEGAGSPTPRRLGVARELLRPIAAFYMTKTARTPGTQPPLAQTPTVGESASDAFGVTGQRFLRIR